MRCPVTWGVDGREGWPGFPGMRLGYVPTNEVLSPAGLVSRQTQTNWAFFSWCPGILRGLMSLASSHLWGWPAVSGCVHSVPSWGPITVHHPSKWQSTTEGSIFVALGNSMPLPCLLWQKCSKRLLVLVLKEGIWFHCRHSQPDGEQLVTFCPPHPIMEQETGYRHFPFPHHQTCPHCCAVSHQGGICTPPAPRTCHELFHLWTSMQHLEI